METKKNIAVVAGGNSSEYYISLKSADQIANSISKQKYNVFVVLLKGCDWTLTNEPYKGIEIDKNDFSFIDNGQKVKFDCVFPAIHGTPGENGLLQGYLDMLKIPYVGCNVLASSLTFNKYYCNSYLKNFKVNISDSILVRNGQNIDENKIIEKVGLPCFVKPNAGGSSFGITKVKEQNQLKDSIDKAFKESDEVIIERFVGGREFTCGLFKTKEKSILLPLAEIVSKHEFFDYDAKYNSALNEEIIPAPISDELTKKCQKLSSEIYDLLNCKGIVRIDYILKDDEFWFLEINTIPGMTSESIVPKMVRNFGMTFDEVADILINSEI